MAVTTSTTSLERGELMDDKIINKVEIERMSVLLLKWEKQKWIDDVPHTKSFLVLIFYSQFIYLFCSHTTENLQWIFLCFYFFTSRKILNFSLFLLSLLSQIYCVCDFHFLLLMLLLQKLRCFILTFCLSLLKIIISSSIEI